MKVHILGAGSMGCLWAAHLKLSSEPSSTYSPLNLSFISTRPHSPETIDFKIESDFIPSKPPPFSKEFSFAIEKQTSIRSTLNCILVCTKSFDAFTSLDSISTLISSDTQIILFQNGLGSQFEILKRFPKNPIYAAVTTEGANRPSENLVIHAGKGITSIGALNSCAQQTKQIEKLKSHLNLPGLNSFLKTQLTQDVWQSLWYKLVINCAINPFTALLDCNNGNVEKSTLFKEKWPELRMELLALVKSSGYPINPKKLDSLVFDVMHKTSNNISSMLQDIRAQKKTEIEDICGFAYRHLEENNISAPTIKYLYNEIQLKSIK